jgi:ankyrin repeat protein
MCATIFGHTDIVTYLLQHGADIHATDYDGCVRIS